MANPSGAEETDQSGTEIAFPKGSVVEGEWRIKPPEKPAEAAHRRRKENWSFWVKEASTYLVALLILLGTAVYCFWVLIQRDPPLDDKKFVMSILTSLLVGIVGYVFGKVTK